MFNKFLRGLLMDEAGGGADLGGGGTAVADTGSADTGITTETALTTTTGTDLATTDDTGDDLSGDTGDTELDTYRGSDPSRSMQSAMQLIQKEHPQLARELPRAVGVRRRLQSMFPDRNPFEAITELQRAARDIEKLGGIDQIRQDLAEIESLDLLYANSNPEMLRRMTTEPEGKSAFVKLMPHAYDLHRQLAPNDFTKYMANVILGDLMGQRVDMLIQRIAEITPKEITQADGTKLPNPLVGPLEALDKYFKRLEGYTQLKSEFSEAPAVDPNRASLDQERQNLQDRENKLVMQDWRREADSRIQTMRDEAWAKATAGKKVSPLDKEDIQLRIERRLPMAVQNVPGYKDRMRGYWESRDRDGYLRHITSVYRDQITRVTNAEVQRRLGTATKTQAAQATGTKTTAVTPAAPGFKRLAAPPAIGLVNRKDTTPDMWRQKKAIMKDGTKVQW